MKFRKCLTWILIAVMLFSSACFSYAGEAEEISGGAVEITGDAADDPEGTMETSDDAGGQSERAAELSDVITEVVTAASIEELAKSSEAADNEPFFSIDVKKETLTEDLATEEIKEEAETILSSGDSTSEKKEALAESLEESGYYAASQSSGSNVEVTSIFAFQRLRLIAPESGELAAYGAKTAVYYDDHYLLTYESEEATRLAFEALKAEYGADSVFIDMPVRSCGTANGWGTSYMKLDQEMKRPDASKNSVTVAVIDSGIAKNHSVFRGRPIRMGYDFVNNDEDPSDDNGHGTSVAGIISESTPLNYTIMPIKALSSNGWGSMEDIMNAVEYADLWGADIINLSLVSLLDESSPNTQAYAAYWDQRIRKLKAIVVCAAGNGDEICGYNMDYPGLYCFPAELGSTICVGACYKNGTRLYPSDFSNYGNAVDFAAPGEALSVADLNGGYSRDQAGTSLASPYIASAAAILKAELSVRNVDDMKGVLGYCSCDAGPSGRDAYCGNGCPVFTGDRRIKAITPSVTLSTTSFTYSGSACTPSVTVRDGNSVLRNGTDYSVTYEDNVNAGTGRVVVSCMNSYYGFAEAGFSILKAPNGLKAAGRKASVKKSKLKKKAQTISAGKMFTVSGAIGQLRYAKVKGSKKLSISSAGKVKVKKKTQKGKYKMLVRITASGDANHSSAYRDVSVTVRVK